MSLLARLRKSGYNISRPLFGCSSRYLGTNPGRCVVRSFSAQANAHAEEPHACRSTSSPSRRQAALMGAGAAAAALFGVSSSAALSDPSQAEPQVKHTDREWRELLSAEQYRVLREHGTERPWSSPFNEEKRPGLFSCAGCGATLFNASAKYESGSGWPSFYAALPDAVTEVSDWSIPFMPRTEIRCSRCGGHLGHVFNDGPQPTRLRYCMNGVALSFEPAADKQAAE